MAKVHNVMSQITLPVINYVPVSGTNLKANCAYFEKKNTFYIFPALVKLQNVFFRYPTTRDKIFVSSAL